LNTKLQLYYLKVSSNVTIAMRCFENFGVGQMPPPGRAADSCRSLRNEMLGWSAYPLPRLDQKVLSVCDEYADVIRWPPNLSPPLRVSFAFRSK